MENLDLKKIIFGLFTLILSIIISYIGQPLIHSNEQAINIIVTVFSILAGFLIAIIAIVGDPILLPPGTWRAAEMDRNKLIKRLIRHKWLFFLYLVTLALIFLSVLFKNKFPNITIWLERFFLLFSIFAFLLSLKLPSVLMQIQQERIDAVIEYRRNKNNIK